MQPALLKLIALSTKGALRRSFRGVKTVRGSLLLGFTLVVIALVVGPSLAGALLVRGKPGLPPFSDWVEPYLPFMVLGASLLVVFTSAAERAFYFTPAEVDLLFPAPFHRRELLFYKLAKTIAGSLVLSLFVAMTSLIYFRSFAAAFVGIWLALVFIQLIGIGTALLGQIIAEQAYNLTRKLILLAIAILLLAGFGEVYARVPVGSAQRTGANVSPNLGGDDSAGTIPGIQLHDHGRPLVSRPDALERGWRGHRSVLARFSDPTGRRLRRVGCGSQRETLRTGAASQAGRRPCHAPIRQGQTNPPAAAPLAGGSRSRGMAAALAGDAHLAARDHDLGDSVWLLRGLDSLLVRGQPGPGALSGAAVGAMAYLTFLFSFQLPWAFRGDVDHMDVLKTLPVRPLALASGELAGGIAVLSAVQLLAVFCFWAAGMSKSLLLFVVVFAVPFDTLLLGINNVLFLIYPARFVPSGTADFQFMGRAMLFMLLEMLALIPCVGLAAGIGAIAYFVSGSSWIAFGIASWIVLVAELPLLFWALAWAFERFDPAIETPA